MSAKPRKWTNPRPITADEDIINWGIDRGARGLIPGLYRSKAADGSPAMCKWAYEFDSDEPGAECATDPQTGRPSLDCKDGEAIRKMMQTAMATYGGPVKKPVVQVDMAGKIGQPVGNPRNTLLRIKTTPTKKGPTRLMRYDVEVTIKVLMDVGGESKSEAKTNAEAKAHQMLEANSAVIDVLEVTADTPEEVQ